MDYLFLVKYYKKQGHSLNTNAPVYNKANCLYYFFGGVTVSLIALIARGGVTVSRFRKLRGGVTVSLFKSGDIALRLRGGVTVSLIAIRARGGVTVSLLIKVDKLFVFEVGLTLSFLVHATMETAIADAIKPIVNSFFILINF